jgi:hypothetical protein
MTHLSVPIQISTNTTLSDDYDCDLSCFIIKGNNVTLDFAGHSATFGNATNVVTVINDNFANWTNSSTPNNWTLLNGTATKTASIYPFGQWDATVSPTAVLKSDIFTLKAGKTYQGFAFARGSSADSYTIELVQASNDTQLATVTMSGGLLNRGFGDGGDPTGILKYKPLTTDTDVYLRFTGIGTSPKIIGMISAKPAFDYGVINASYKNATYEPDGPDLYGSASNVTIKNGTINQGLGDGVRSSGIKYSGTNFTVTNMTINVNGINTMGIDGTYSTGGTLTGNTISSTSKSVFDRMHGAGGIFVDNTTPNYAYTITNNTITGVPQYGINIYSCYTDTDTTSYNISGNTITNNELVTEGYGIGISGLINATVDNNTITPTKGRGMLIDSVGCVSPNKAGTNMMKIAWKMSVSGLEIGEVLTARMKI